LFGGLILTKGDPHMTVLGDAYRYEPENDHWERLCDLPFSGYAWSAAAVDDHHVLLAGRASEDANISKSVWLVNVDTMSTTLLGEAVVPTCCAALVQVDVAEWWLVGGEPDAKRSRTPKITAISLKDITSK
jgi:hypothetical protein